MKGVLLKRLSPPIHVNTHAQNTPKKITTKIKTWAVESAHVCMPAGAHPHSHTQIKRGNSERCHLCEERSVFQTVSGSEFAFSVECKSGWIKQHLASADGLSLCICACICVCMPALWWCPQAPGFDAGKSVDTPFSCRDPSLSFPSLKVSFHCFLAHHLSLCFHLLCCSLFSCLFLSISITRFLFLLYFFLFNKQKDRVTREGVASTLSTYNLKTHTHNTYTQMLFSRCQLPPISHISINSYYPFNLFANFLFWTKNDVT